MTAEVVFVPYRGIYFLYPLRVVERRVRMMRFRPLSGNLLSLRAGRRVAERTGEVFVPYRGIYFLYLKKRTPKTLTLFRFSSPIGESTFSTTKHETGECTGTNFRPLSGNLLSLQELDLSLDQIKRIFVPYRGIYFLYSNRVYVRRGA